MIVRKKKWTNVFSQNCLAFWRSCNINKLIYFYFLIYFYIPWKVPFQQTGCLMNFLVIILNCFISIWCRYMIIASNVQSLYSHSEQSQKLLQKKYLLLSFRFSSFIQHFFLRFSLYCLIAFCFSFSSHAKVILFFLIDSHGASFVLKMNKNGIGSLSVWYPRLDHNIKVVNRNWNNAPSRNLKVIMSFWN